VIVSPVAPFTGVFFKRGAIYIAKIIPYRGSWVEFEYDQKNLLYVRVGKRKFLASIFLRALGVWLNSKLPQQILRQRWATGKAVKNSSFRDEDLLRAFYTVDEARVEDGSADGPGSGVRADKPGRMKVDFEIKGRGPESDYPQGQGNQPHIARGPPQGPYW